MKSSGYIYIYMYKIIYSGNILHDQVVATSTNLHILCDWSIYYINRQLGGDSCKRMDICSIISHLSQ